jgi:hypothetical protein
VDAFKYVYKLNMAQTQNNSRTHIYRGADKSLAWPTSLFKCFFQYREEVVVRRGQIRRIGWMIKTLEAQVGQFILGCKYPVSRFLPGRAKDLSAPL